jgi:hypothetical protein
MRGNMQIWRMIIPRKENNSRYSSKMILKVTMRGCHSESWVRVAALHFIYSTFPILFFWILFSYLRMKTVLLNIYFSHPQTVTTLLLYFTVHTRLMYVYTKFAVFSATIYGLSLCSSHAVPSHTVFLLMYGNFLHGKRILTSRCVVMDASTKLIWLQNFTESRGMPRLHCILCGTTLLSFWLSKWSN